MSVRAKLTLKKKTPDARTKQTSDAVSEASKANAKVGTPTAPTAEAWQKRATILRSTSSTKSPRAHLRPKARIETVMAAAILQSPKRATFRNIRARSVSLTIPGKVKAGGATKTLGKVHGSLLTESSAPKRKTSPIPKVTTKSPRAVLTTAKRSAPKTAKAATPETTNTETTKAVTPETTKTVTPETTKAVTPETTKAVTPETVTPGTPVTGT